MYCTCDQHDVYDAAAFCDATLVYNHCHSNPCQHGGTCSLKVNGYNCTCPPSKSCDLMWSSCESLWHHVTSCDFSCDLMWSHVNLNVICMDL